MADAFIKVNNLVKTFDTPAGPLNVLRGINLDKSTKGILSRWSGRLAVAKTTFLNMLTAVDTPTGGDGRNRRRADHPGGAAQTDQMARPQCGDRLPVLPTAADAVRG